jgi:multicomponent Na+:H+ antiporter subunit G
MSRAADVATITLVLMGAGLSLVGAIGVHRFRDPFARMHAATKPVTLGLLLVGAGAALQTTDSGDIVKIALAVGLQFVTAPLGMHLLGRSAYHVGELDPRAPLDEFAPEATQAPAE